MTRRGFTLLEVVVALAIIAVALVAVIRTQGQGWRLTEDARFTTRALFLADDLLAQSQVERDLGPGDDDGPFEDPDADLAWRRLVTSAGLPGLLKIEIWVHRADDPFETGLSLRGFTYRGTP